MILPTASLAPPTPPNARLREAATALEASFLKEMLQAAGLGRVPGMSGGAGEEQFASFLLDAQARRMAEAGGVGLASAIMASMERMIDATPVAPTGGRQDG